MQNQENQSIDNHTNNINQPTKQVNTESVYFFALLFKYKIFIIIFTLIFTIGSIIYSITLPNWYSATVNAVPPKGTGSFLESSLGNISSALKEFGMTRISGKSESSYSYLVILDSRTVKDSIIKKYNLRQVYEMEDSKFEDIRSTFEDNLEISLEPEGNFKICIYDKDKQKAVDMVKDYFEIANNIAQDLFQKESKANSEFLVKRIKYTDSTLAILSDSLKRFSKIHSIISPEDQAKSITNALSNLKAELINQEVLYEIIRNRFGEQDIYTQMQKKMVDELSQKVQDAQQKPGFAGNFALTDATSVGLEFMRLYSEIETLTKVKLFLVPLLEEAKLNEVRQKQALYIVDEPILADKKARPKRSFIVAGSALGSFILSVLFIVLFNSYKKFKVQYKEIIG